MGKGGGDGELFLSAQFKATDGRTCSLLLPWHVQRELAASVIEAEPRSAAICWC